MADTSVRRKGGKWVVTRRSGPFRPALFEVDDTGRVLAKSGNRVTASDIAIISKTFTKAGNHAMAATIQIWWSKR